MAQQTEKKTTKTIVELLSEVQSELKAPKGQRNLFGKYNFRSAEDIVEAVKPLLNSRGLILNVSDELVMIGERYYIKSTSSVIDKEHNLVQAVGYAREALSQSGMSEGQVTGATSSYARKYSLNGLFAIDDTKDLDTEEFQSKSKDDSAKLATKTTTAPKVPSTPTVKKGWLNKGTQEFELAKAGLEAGTKTLDDILKDYNLSGVIRKELESLVTK